MLLHHRAVAPQASVPAQVRRHACTAALLWAGLMSSAAWANATPAQATPNESGLSTKQVAQTMAIGDSLSTGLGLAAGAAEANPLVNTSPLGLVALAGMKLLMLNHIDQYPDERRVPLQRKMSSFWGGLSANNLLLAAGATGGLAVPAGILAGYLIYNSEKFEQAEAQALAKAEQQKPDFKTAPTYTVVTELTVRPAAADGSYDPSASLTTLDVRTTNPLLAKVSTYLHPDGTKYYVEGHRLKTAV